jgi:DNA-binding transcriptional ArsR family regulator
MPIPIERLEARAAEAAQLLRQLANANRMLLLCHLAAQGEATVGGLAGHVGLSPAALSQHLARLRAEGLVACRRESTRAHYRIADPRVERLMRTLHDVFCRGPGTPLH